MRARLVSTKRIGGDNRAASALPVDQRPRSPRRNLRSDAGFGPDDVKPQRLSAASAPRPISRSDRRVRELTEKWRRRAKPGENLAQKFSRLPAVSGRTAAEAGDVAAGPRQAADHAPLPTGSSPTAKTIGMVEVAPLAAARSCASTRPYNDIDLEQGEPDRRSSPARSTIPSAAAVFDRNVAALDPAEFTQSLHEGSRVAPVRPLPCCEAEIAATGRDSLGLLRAGGEGRMSRPRRPASAMNVTSFH